MVTSLVDGEMGIVEMWVYDGAGGWMAGGLWSCLCGCALESDMLRGFYCRGDLKKKSSGLLRKKGTDHD